MDSPRSQGRTRRGGDQRGVEAGAAGVGAEAGVAAVGGATFPAAEPAGAEAD